MAGLLLLLLLLVAGHVGVVGQVAVQVLVDAGVVVVVVVVVVRWREGVWVRGVW